MWFLRLACACACCIHHLCGSEVCVCVVCPLASAPSAWYYLRASPSQRASTRYLSAWHGVMFHMHSSCPSIQLASFMCLSLRVCLCVFCPRFFVCRPCLLLCLYSVLTCHMFVLDSDYEFRLRSHANRDHPSIQRLQRFARVTKSVCVCSCRCSLS